MKKKRNSSGFHSSFGPSQAKNNKLRGLQLTASLPFYALLLLSVAASSVNGIPITSVDSDSDNSYRRSSPYSSSLHYTPKQRITSSSAIVFPEERANLIPKSKKDFMNYKGDDGNRIEFPYEPAGLREYSHTYFATESRPPRRNYGIHLGERIFEGNADENAGRLEGGPTRKRYLVNGFNYPAMNMQKTTTRKPVPVQRETGETSDVDAVDTNEVDPEVPKLIGEFTEYLRGKKYFKGNRSGALRTADAEPANFSFNAAGIQDRNCTNGTVKSGDECKIALE